MALAEGGTEGVLSTALAHNAGFEMTKTGVPFEFYKTAAINDNKSHYTLQLLIVIHYNIINAKQKLADT